MITHWRNIIDFQFCEGDVVDDLHSLIGASLLKLCQLAKRSMRYEKAMCHVPCASFAATKFILTHEYIRYTEYISLSINTFCSYLAD